MVDEGVETVEQLNFLREINCDYVQGYYLSKPEDGMLTQALLEANKKRREKSG